MYPGNAGLGCVVPLDSSQGFDEIREVHTLLLDLHAAERIDILVCRHGNLGLEGHLKGKVYSLGRERVFDNGHGFIFDNSDVHIVLRRSYIFD